MRRYETIYILRPTLSEDEINSIIEGTNTILGADAGQIITLDKWGLRKLAYLIKKEAQGYYVFCDYATAPANVTEMERKFRIDENVMKYMTVKLADSITDDGIEAARGEHEAAKAAKAAAEAETSETETSEAKKSDTRTKEVVTPEVKEEVVASEKEEVATPEVTDSEPDKSDDDK